MDKSGTDQTQGWVIDTKRWVDGWRKLYPHKTAHHVASDLDAPLRTVEKWLSSESRPSFDWFGPILCRYGLAFVISGMPSPTAYLDDLARAETRARLMAERQAIDEMLAADWKRRIGA